MGRQAFITRLALGRSPLEKLQITPTEEEVREAELEAKIATESGTYVPSSAGYVQRYDCRAYPQNLASRNLRKQSRRARNSVLALFGVCTDHTGHIVRPLSEIKKHLPIDPAKIQRVRKEDTLGRRLDIVGRDLFVLTSICLQGIRNRVQTFHFYADAGLWKVLKFEWSHFGPGRLIFAGAPASFFHYVHMLFQDKVPGFGLSLMQKKIWPFSSRKRGTPVKKVPPKVKKILEGIFFLLFVPLEIHATLQRLVLVPMWPFFPSLMAFLPFTSESFLQAPGLSQSFSLRSCAGDLRSLALSPFVLLYILSYGKRRAHGKIATCISYYIPRPENPDTLSLMGLEVDDQICTNELGLGIIGERSLLDEVKQDILAFTRKIRSRLIRWRSIWDGTHVEVKSRNPSGSVVSPLISDQTSNDLSNFARLPALRAVLRETRGSLNPNEFATHKGYSWYPHGYEGPSGNIRVPTLPKHRVTCLTEYLAYTMINHIAYNLADLLFIPLETLFLRSVARRFLASPQAQHLAGATPFRSPLLPLGTRFGLGLGRGGWRGIVHYAGMIGWCWGFKVVAGYLTWQLGAGIIWWLAPWPDPQ